MHVIVCLDDRGGMLFNRRRQSQDRVLRARVLAMTAGGELWVSPYSAKQFQKHDAPQLRVADEPWREAPDGAFCFVEERDPAAFEAEIERLIVYRWNRVYPADLRFGIDLTGWRLVSGEDFAGSSHESITEEVYER